MSRQKTVKLELYEPKYRDEVDFTLPHNRNALDEAELMCLGKYCDPPVENGGTFGSFDIHINEVEKNYLTLSTSHKNISEVLKAFDKYAVTYTELKKYKEKGHLFMQMK